MSSTSTKRGMANRCDHFLEDREPFHSTAALQLEESRTSGPLTFLNPTQAYLRHVETKSVDASSTGREEAAERDKASPQDQYADNVRYRWSSRDNRKGRHQLVATPAKDASAGKYLVPADTASPKIILQTIGKMLTNYPYWDVSWLVASIFTWGSIIWVINACFVWFPLVRPSSEFKDEISAGGGITAFIGATVFEIGSFFLMLEAINENRTGCFGWALSEVIDNNLRGKRSWRISPDQDACTHHHVNKHNLVSQSGNAQGQDVEKATDSDQSQKTWSWCPSWTELKSHYFHELGFIACCFQLFGASVFWISGLTALPGIYNLLSPGLLDGIYWTPQVVGGSGFIVSGFLFMLETQKKWYLPALNVLGWHIGFWNFIGGLGFTFCPAFGYDTASWAQYEASLSTFWGSWAFLIGSLIQLYESLQKHPVDVDKSGGDKSVDKTAVTPANGESKSIGN